ncbi:MAG: Mrp/NBP35 family ATP-binding protein [Candidatus Dormibacteria bacterium]
MSAAQILAAIEKALGSVMDPELHRDLVSLDMVRDLAFEGGVASMRIVLTTPACPLKDRIHSDIEAALVGGVDGVNSILVTWDAKVTGGRGLPGLQGIPGVRNAVAVSAGKGGVGKTTVSVNIALALSRSGARVGLLDADVYGPNVPIMLGVTSPPEKAESGKIRPLEACGIKVISFGTILKPGQPVIWRGPMLAKGLREFLYEVEWGELDYMIIDLPPGTGDVQLSLAQSMPMTGAVIVTTPQDVSVADVSRGIQMLRQLNVPVLGLIENMSGFICPHCNERTEIFGSGGGPRLSAQYSLPLLGSIPLDPRIRLGGENGLPLMATAAGPMGEVFESIAGRIAGEVSKQNFAASDAPELPGRRMAADAVARVPLN